MTISRRGLLSLPAVAGLAACGPAPGTDPDEEVDETVGTTVRLAYGDDESQFAELSYPTAADGAAPVCVLIHGGYWRAQYGAELARPLAPSLLERGWATLVIEYRRVGNGGGYPATLDDVAAAVDLLAGDEAAAAGELDLTRVAAVGHSAGGHLAAWLATRPGQADGDPGAAPAVPLAAVVSQAGVLDLLRGAELGLGGGAVQELLGGGPDEVPDAYAVADPSARLPLGVPVLCVHGTDDGTVPLEQSTGFATAATAAGDDVEVREVPGDHFVVIDPEDDSWTGTLDWLDALR